jgi:hypothetical protein
MKKNRLELGEIPQTGQSLSRLFDVIMGDFVHILWTRAISCLNALISVYGGVHHGADAACSDMILRSRRARNLFANRP